MSSGSERRGHKLRVGALLLLAGFFTLSALLRAGEVIAQLPESDDGFGNPLPKQHVAGREDAAGPERVEVGPAELIEELRRQRLMLEERESELLARETRLQGLNAHLSRRLTEVREAGEALRNTANLVEGAASRDVDHLAQMYQQMKPKQAAGIFDEMPPSFAVGLIAEMRPDTAALIMANMNPEKAYAVSLLLASRNVRED